MRYFLDACYALLLAAISPWIAYKAITTGKYRQGWWQKLGAAPRRDGRRVCLWLHGVSVGEILALRNVVDAVRRCRPDWELVVSTTTNTGLEMARTHFPDLTTFYYPLDFSWAVDRAIDRVRPDAIVLVETELWPNFLLAAARRHIPVALVNGRIAPKSFRRYHRIRYLLAHILRGVRAVGAQTQTYADRFARLGVDPERITVTGSVKYDAVLTDRDNPKTRELARLLAIGPGDRLFIAGSTQDPEERIACELYERLKPRYPHLRLIVVPRHKERFEEVARMLAARPYRLVRRSRLTDEPLGRSDAVVLLDTLGELQHLWGTAEIAFVGGSLTARGGQNMLDPAGVGCAVLFGPNTWNFQATVEQLLAVDGARVVADAAELEAAVGDLLDHPEHGTAMAERARAMIASQQGATRRTVDLLSRVMPRA